MSQPPFRFLHAADLHLEAAMEGLADAQASLVELLVDCPLRAAARVFDAAIDQQVDFALLAGGVVDPNRSGPREWLFLMEQFQRLADRGIACLLVAEPRRTSGIVATVTSHFQRTCDYFPLDASNEFATSGTACWWRNWSAPATGDQAHLGLMNLPPARPARFRSRSRMPIGARQRWVKLVSIIGRWAARISEVRHRS